MRDPPKANAFWINFLAAHNAYINFQGETRVKSMNSVPINEYVTLNGNHSLKGTLTASGSTRLNEIKLLGTLNNKNFEEDYLLRNVDQNIKGLLLTISIS